MGKCLLLIFSFFFIWFFQTLFSYHLICFSSALLCSRPRSSPSFVFCWPWFGRPAHSEARCVLEDSDDDSWGDQDDICSLCQRRFEEQGRWASKAIPSLHSGAACLVAVGATMLFLFASSVVSSISCVLSSYLFGGVLFCINYSYSCFQIVGLFYAMWSESYYSEDQEKNFTKS